MTKIELITQITGQKRMTIELVNGFTAEKVVALLTQRKAHISNGEIIIPAPLPAEGFRVAARISEYTEDMPANVWVVAQPTACS